MGNTAINHQTEPITAADIFNGAVVEGGICTRYVIQWDGTLDERSWLLLSFSESINGGNVLNAYDGKRFSASELLSQLRSWGATRLKMSVDLVPLSEKAQ